MSQPLLKHLEEGDNMTAQQAIERANSFKQGNTASDEQKLEWLTELDGMVYDECVLTHLHPLPVHGRTSRWWTVEDGKWVFAPAPVYTTENVNDELIAEKPYNEFYVYWLMAKIDLHSQDLNRYNNDYAQFETAYQQFKNRYHRTHRSVPLPNVKVGEFR